MWSDNDIDQAFRRLNPPDPEPTPFPLDGWLRLEKGLDEALIERAVRRRLWKFFAAEVIVVALLFLGWLAWPTAPSRRAAHSAQPAPAAAVASAPPRVPGSARLARVLPPMAAPTPAPASTAAAPQPAAGFAPPSATAEAARPRRAVAASRQPAATTCASAPGAGPGSGPGLALAATPAANHPGSADTRHSMPRAEAEVSPDTRRHRLPGTLPAIGGGISNEGSRRLTPIQPGRAARALAGVAAPDAPAAGTAARQLTSNAAGPANTAARPRRASPAAGRQPARGSVAAPAGTVGAMAAVAPAQARHGSRLPLAGLAAPGRAIPGADEARSTATAAVELADGKMTSTGATATDAAAIAALAPNVARLPLTTADLPAPLAPVAAVPANLPAPVRQPRFYVGLVAAPDLSTVKFVDVERPKLNVGVVLEYRLTNRLRVSTGLLRVNKQYLARREDYDWSAYPRAATRNFRWVDGSCTVLDIPLNLRYDALVRPQARLFGSVGLSSFFMQRERYQYDYTEYNTTYVWDRTFTNESQHLFKVLNLSFGYEHRVGPHWSLQAEPYVKVPLAGVGVGKLQLTSGGVFFGVKYGF